MFGRKKDEAENKRGADDLLPPPLKPFSRKGTHAPVKPPASPAFLLEAQRRATPEIPGGLARRPDRGIAGNGDNKRLVIGRDISLSGEITSCDRLIVEGRAEVVLTGVRILEVAPSGLFKGTAEVQEADILGSFEGDLTALDLLTVRAGGRVSGVIRYGRVIVESGGEISGDMQALEGGGEKPPAAKAKK